mmetsp:Transcript_26434/g.55833  ORF Transcript_26434/g.55833 Transcript_26434/m.55833 type:complete len:224 (-) Transcript_26434:670-1341(-)
MTQYTIVGQGLIKTPCLTLGNTIGVHFETVGVRNVKGDGRMHTGNDSIVNALFCRQGAISCSILAITSWILEAIVFMNGRPHFFGTVSGITGISFGIEPQIHYHRRILLFFIICQWRCFIAKEKRCRRDAHCPTICHVRIHHGNYLILHVMPTIIIFLFIVLTIFRHDLVGHPIHLLCPRGRLVAFANTAISQHAQRGVMPQFAFAAQVDFEMGKEGSLNDAL